MLHSFQKVAPSLANAGKQAVEAGVDLEAPGPACYQYLDSLVNKNIVKESTIDTAVARVLRTKFKIGLFEKPFVDTTAIDDKIHTEQHIKLSKKVADESLVLLKNEKDLLPLGDDIKSVALIGPNADQVQFGDYTWSRKNKYGLTIREGLEQLKGNKLKVNYAKGCDMISLDKSGIPEAVQKAKNSDVAIVCIGTASASLARDYSNSTSGEGFDLSDTDPTGVQRELVQQVYRTGTPTIVVLIQGKPFSIPWMKENVPAILEAWYPGEQGGLSIAEALFGKVNPSGRLPVSFPKSVGHLPCYYNYLPTDKGYYRSPGEYGDPGRDYVFSRPEPLWPFGFGLSYTEFEYNNIEVSDTTINSDGQINIAVTVKNTGQRSGKETVQLYIRDKYGSIVRPVKELKDFQKITLEPGQTKTITFQQNIRDWGYYNNQGDYLLEPGDFEIMIGRNSREIELKKTVQYISEAS
jgi:beta-glucosidase